MTVHSREVTTRRGGFDETVSDQSEPGRRAKWLGQQVEMANRWRIDLRDCPGIGPSPGANGLRTARDWPNVTHRRSHPVRSASRTGASAVAARPAHPADRRSQALV